MRRIISLIGAALSLAACTNATAPDTSDRAAAEAKAKAALGGIEKVAAARKIAGN